MNKLKSLIIAPLFIGLISVSCSSDDGSSTKAECIEHFNYDETTVEGPSSWDNYCVADGSVNQCGSVVRQSPINITGAVMDPTLPMLDIQYSTSSTDILNNGHTIQFNYNGPLTSTLNFGGERYNLLQFHFHASSEHTVAGDHHPLEAHLVHKSASGDLAVIGVFFKLGAENSLLSEFTEHLPSHKGDTYTKTDLNYMVSDLISEGGYYNYSGSLTTPPCSEIVEWIVMEEPLEASQAQLDAFSSILHDNYRPVQPLNGRTIKHRPSVF